MNVDILLIVAMAMWLVAMLGVLGGVAFDIDVDSTYGQTVLIIASTAFINSGFWVVFTIVNYLAANHVTIVIH